MYLVLLGAPGAGKGTQAAIIAQKTGLTHIASGDLFRQAVQKGTELGKLVKSYMDKGELAPDEVTISVIMERLGEPDCEKGCIFDGFPRTLDQAKALEEKLSEQKKGIDKAVFIDVPDEELMSRLCGRWTCKNCQAVYHEVASPPKVAGKCDKCGGELYQRPDDNEATIKERLKVYFNQTTPVLDYYKNNGKLIAVDGKLSIDEVAEKVIRILNG
jgi:adenylate kinase